MAKSSKISFSPTECVGLLNTLNAEAVQSAAGSHYALATLKRLVSAIEQGQPVVFHRWESV